MPAKDNDPTVPTSPATTPAKTPARKAVRKVAKQTDQATSDTELTEIAAPTASARRRRTPAETAMAGSRTAAPKTAAPKTAAPKRRRAAAPAVVVTPASLADRAAPLDGTANVAATTADATPADATRPVEDEVRLRAYLLYVARGHRAGSPDSDWLQAEREVMHGRER